MLGANLEAKRGAKLGAKAWGPNLGAKPGAKLGAKGNGQRYETI